MNEVKVYIFKLVDDQTGKTFLSYIFCGKIQPNSSKNKMTSAVFFIIFDSVSTTHD